MQKVNLKNISVIFPLSLTLVSMVNILVNKFGPKPYINSDNPYVNNPDLTLREVKDFYILIGWFIVTLIIFIFYSYKSNFSQINIQILNLIGFSLTFIFVTWSIDLHETMYGIPIWKGIKFTNLILGVIFGLLIVKTLNSKMYRKLNLFFILLLLLYVIPNFIQTPIKIGDENHFNFVINDLLANSVGKFPLYDYFPIYTNVLGYPLLVFKFLITKYPIQIGFYYILFLQLICFFIIFLILKIIIPKRYLYFSLLLAIVPLLANNEMGRNPATYFPIFPLRIILPLLIFYFAISAIYRKKNYSFTLGLLMALNSFNNLEFGFTSSLAILFGFLIFKQKLINSNLNFKKIFYGFTSFFVLLILIFFLIGKPLDLSKLFIFIKLTLSGYYAISMETFGIHLPIVALFMTSILIGFYLCNQATNIAGRQFKIGFSLFVIGLWSLICLPYFTGRSFPSTALGGFAIHYSLLFSLLAVLILTNLKQNLHLSKINFASSSLFQIFALSIFISLIMNLNNPINKFRDLKTYNQTSANFSQTLNNLNGLLSDPNSDLKILVKNNQISQALMLSAAIELKTGLKSELITNHPYHIEVSKLYSNLQCVYFDKSDQAFLLVSESTFAALKNDSSCKKSLDFENVQFLVFEESKFVIISKK